MKITACIITNNEESNIRNAIESLKFADEIVVVDSESTDKTAEISAQMGAQVFTQKWLGFGKQKQSAVDKSRNDWIFSLDADERVSTDLADEISRLKEQPESELADGYRISRLSYYMGKPIRHCGWYPDWQLRFFNRQKGRWGDAEVHESVELPAGARIKKLKKDILHFSVSNASSHHRMIGERYAPLAARQMFEGGYRTSKLKVAAAGLLAFTNSYVIKAGFLDGFPGFCISRFAAHHAYLKNLLLWELQNQKIKKMSGK